MGLEPEEALVGWVVPKLQSLEQKWANFLCKGPDSKHFRLRGPDGLYCIVFVGLCFGAFPTSFKNAILALKPGGLQRSLGGGGCNSEA